jgi:hypothetical protein
MTIDLGTSEDAVSRGRYAAAGVSEHVPISG